MTTDDPSLEPIRIQPVEDARVRFYLDNYRAIETWAHLRSEANDVLHELLLDLVGVLAEDAQDIDPDIIVESDTGQRRRSRIAITRRSWHDPGGPAPAAVVIEWHRPPLDNAGELYLYVGIRVRDRRRRDRALADQLSALAPTLKRQLGRPWEPESEAFPVWRWITPDGDGLDELALLDQARSAAWQCWHVAAKEIDRLLTQMP